MLAPLLLLETAAAPTIHAVGDTIYAEGASPKQKGIVLAAPDDIMNRRLSAGFYPMIREDAHYSWHSIAKAAGDGDIGYQTGLKDARQLRASKDRQQLCLSLGPTAFGLKPCDTELAYTRVERPSGASGGHRLELTYDGRVGDVIRVGYHEQGGGGVALKDGTLEFDLRRTRIIAYRTLRIEVLSADAGSISCRVIAGDAK